MQLPFAYIDPMSGSIVLQVVIAGTLAVFAACYRRVGRFVSWLSGRKPTPTVPTEQAPAAPADRKAA